MDAREESLEQYLTIVTSVERFLSRIEFMVQ